MYNEDIFELAGNLETPMITSELQQSNDFYGDAYILKKYAGIPTSYPLKAVVEHGPSFQSSHWLPELKAPFPAFITSSSDSSKYIYQLTQKLPLTIGPIIAYAKPYLSRKKSTELKKKLGKNLLVFIPHATHSCSVEIKNNYVITEIEKEAKNYDSVTISIYWREITSELVKYYSSHGYHCVTCGHMFDNHFLNRQRTILELCDSVLSFGMISAIYYAAYFNKNLKIIPDNDFALFHLNPQKKIDVADQVKREKEIFQKYNLTLRKIFKTMTSPTPAIKNFMEQTCTYSQIKKPKELKNFFTIAEEMYTLPQILGLKRYAHPLEMLKIYEKLGEEKKFKTLTGYLQAIQVLK